jgi:hypothetical protein
MGRTAPFDRWKRESADPWPAGKLLPRSLSNREQPAWGPGAQLSGPDSFFVVGPPSVFYKVPKSAPIDRTLSSLHSAGAEEPLGNDKEQIP